MDFKLIIPRSVSLHHCPKCDSIGSLDRVRIDGLLDKIFLKVFQVRTYHCRECRWTGRIFLYKIRNNPWKILSNYGILALILILVSVIVKLIFGK